MKEYKIGQAAKYLGKSVKTLQRLDKNGKLPANRTKSGRRFYDKYQLENYRIQEVEKKQPAYLADKFTAKVEPATKMSDEAKYTIEDVLAFYNNNQLQSWAVTDRSALSTFPAELAKTDSERTYYSLDTCKLIDYADLNANLMNLYLNYIYQELNNMPKQIVLVIPDYHRIEIMRLASINWRERYKLAKYSNLKVLYLETEDNNIVYHPEQHNHYSYSYEKVKRLLKQIANRYHAEKYIKDKDKFYMHLYNVASILAGDDYLIVPVVYRLFLYIIRVQRKTNKNMDDITLKDLGEGIF